MIISRAEFHKRMSFDRFKTIREAKELMSVDMLYKEIQADAPFRNHNYMFKKGMDIDSLEIQEEAVGIKKAYPNITTEGERFALIRKEMEKGTYKSVPVLRDIDYPDVIYVDDGFHRIAIAHQLGWKVINVKAKYGKFMLSKSITFSDLVLLLDMLEKLFGKKYDSIKKLKQFLQKLGEVKGKIDVGHWSISYGRDEE